VLSPPGSNSIKSHSKKLAVSADRKRDPALFNLAIDSKRLGCDVIALKAEDITAVQNVAIGPGCVKSSRDVMILFLNRRAGATDVRLCGRN
jgi:hypothetical protein